MTAYSPTGHLNVRSGSGFQYPVVAQMAASAPPAVTGYISDYTLCGVAIRVVTGWRLPSISFATFAVLCIATLLAPPVLAETPVATAAFKCQGGKSIDATSYANSVDLKLSDGRSFGVPQAMSVSGAQRKQGRDVRVLEQGLYRLRH